MLGGRGAIPVSLSPASPVLALRRVRADEGRKRAGFWEEGQMSGKGSGAQLGWQSQAHARGAEPGGAAQPALAVPMGF